MAEKLLIALLFVTILHDKSHAVQYFSVPEEQEAGTFVGNFTRRENFKYYFSGQVDFFTIDPDLGSIFTKTKIDREKLVSDDLQYFVLSSAPVYATEISIKVTDINDNEPKFRQSQVNIEIFESVEVGTLIPLESAIDPDLGQNSVTSYSIVSGNDDDKFSLEIILNLLHLKVKNKLDRELQSSYSLNISAADNGMPRKYGYASLNITILDVNDNAPLFNPTTYKAEIFENATVGTFLLEMRATDQDSGSNGQISYSLKDTSLFTINRVTGVISLKSELDREIKPSVVLDVEAVDGGSSPLIATATVTVTVKDVNDNKPVINTNGVTQKDLIENRLHHNFLFIQVTDEDFKPTSLVIISGNDNNKFFLNKLSESFYFISARSLDREEKSSYSLLLRASDSGVPQLTTDYKLVIDVQDVNDNSPLFEKSVNTAEIMEGCPKGTYVSDVKARDFDSGSNSIIHYNITSGNYNNWFKISQTTGLITTNFDGIDYDILNNTSIVLTVTATDHGNPPLNSNSSVVISIRNANDDAPRFRQQLYEKTVSESLPLNSLILTVIADDSDKGVDGQVHYEFHYASDVVTSTFNINRISGEITLQKKLEYFYTQHYVFYVLAIDGGNPTKHSKTLVKLHVSDTDNHPPVFSTNEFFVNIIASKTPGVVGTFNALDADSGVFGQIRYSIESPSCCNYFLINPVTGLLNTSRVLSMDNKYRLSINADSNGQTTRAFINIVVVENLLQNPSFSRNEYSFHVEENAPGKFVGKILLLNSLQSVHYFIGTGNEFGFFRINEKGEIFSNKSIDREKHSSFALQVSVRTNQSMFLTASTKVTVLIEDVNDNKPVLTNQKITGYFVREDAIVGQHILTVSATDADYGENAVLRYSIQQDPAMTPFAIDFSTGHVFLTRSLMNMNQSQYAIDVDISDMGAPKQSTTIRFFINVIDLNDHSPEFSASLYNVIIPRNLSVNSRFIKVEAKDADFGNNSKLLFQIQSGDTEKTFDIFPSGWIYLKALSLNANIDYYLLEIIAYDQGHPVKSTTAKVAIFVQQTATQQIFRSTILYASVTENEPPGTFIVNMSNNVVTGHGITSFKLFKESSYIDVNQGNGVIQTKTRIDREAVSSTGNDTIVSVIVAERTRNNTAIKESCILVLIILDENDNAPVFEKSVYNAIVNETIPTSTPFLTVHAVDRDHGTTSTILYEIQPAQTHFQIHASSGVLSIATSTALLDYSQTRTYNFSVIAKDSANSSMFGTCKVFVHVRDQNNNKPVFTKSTTTLSISETTVVGTSLFTFAATDKDTGMNGFVTYGLRSNNAQGTFQINEYSGVMYLAKEVDFEVLSIYDVIVTAMDHGTAPLQETVAVRILIQDFNDNAPTFSLIPNTIFVPENAALSTIIGVCTATDRDSGMNKAIRYSAVKQGPISGKFIVNSENCQVSVNGMLDREEQNTYYIVIKAEDSAENEAERLSSTKNITIMIEDVNDNVPIFQPPIAAGFSRTASTGWEIIKVTAVDPDEGSNGTVWYSVSSKLDSACFAINPQTGSVTVVAPLSNTKKLFEIEVKASDQGSKVQKHSTTLVRFFVTGATSDAPTCSGTGQASLYENVPIGTNVYKVNAVSTEANSQMLYYIKSGNLGNSFALNASTGWIYTQRFIDFDYGIRRYNLLVFAIEKAGSIPRNTECSVQIDIKDVNDNMPVFPFSAKTIYVPENAKIGDKVFMLHATDYDSGDNGLVEYAITAGNTLSTFSVEASSGMIQLAKSLDRETIASFYLTVEASNKGSQKSYAQLHVAVLDVNDNAPIFNQTFYSFTLPENSPYHFYVGIVKADDKDTGRNGEIYYEIVDKNQDTFSIDHSTGAIRVSGNLNYELIPNYMFDVRAIDYGETPMSSTVTVFVNLADVNDNCPVFTSIAYTTSIEENSPAGISVFKVLATDNDSGDNGKVTYQIIDGNALDSFSVSSNGDVIMMRQLDREQTPFFRLLISARDNGKVSLRNCLSYTKLTITVLDVNDNVPSLNTPHVIHILESSVIGSTVHSFTATDNDFGVNSTVKFAFIGPNDVSDVFHLAEDGSLSLARRLDFETKKQYTVNISISDLGTPSLASVSIVTISVIDANDNSPIINPHPSVISVLENATIGSTLMELSATDLDSGENSRITFSIASGNQNGTFDIESSSGILYLQHALNREAREYYQLDIEAKDNGLPQRRGISSLRIVVVDVNDCVPSFSSLTYNVSVLENSLVSDILTVHAFDCDSGSNAFVRYSLEKSLLSDQFSIDESTGKITLLHPLDRELNRVVTLQVTARDNGAPSLFGRTTVFVNIQDENDNAPQISPSNVTKSLKENLNINFEVQRFQITDPDDGLNGAVDVSLVDNFGSFQLTRSGVVYLLSTTRRLDRETIAYYQLQLEASDQGNPKRTSFAYVHLYVEDDNDSPPVFTRKRYEVKTESNAPAGNFIVQVKTTDQDTVANSNVQFAIVSGNASYVEIESGTGIIVTKIPIPVNMAFEIGVEVSDPTKLEFKDNAIVSIEATTGFPKFSHGNLYDTLSESSLVGTFVKKINATSEGTGHVGVIHYFIHSGNVGLAFRIEENTGRILVNRALDYETLRDYSLWIEARDSKIPPQSAFVKFSISLRNENDSVPSIISPRTTVQFTENQGSNAFVTRVVAIDIDNPSSTARLRYALGTSAALLPFTIDSMNGEVRSKRYLDREETSKYLLEVVVYPEGQIWLSASYNVSIAIQDLNDNQPIVHNPSRIEIPESLPVNSQVAVLNVTDKDVGPNGVLSFYLISDTFRIDSNTGQITLIKSLDREVQETYTLSIQVRDPSYQKIHILTVIITDINDSPPYFPSALMYVNVSESSPVGQIFGQVQALDKDIDDNAACYYHIEPRSGDGFISIDPMTGSLRLKRKVKFIKDAASNNTLQFTLKARNVHSPFYVTQAKLIITILDANDHAPVFSRNIYKAYVESVAAIGQVIAFVSAKDEYDVGLNAEVVYSIAGGNGSNVFSLDGNSIKVKANLQSFANSILQLVVESADKGIPRQKGTAIVNIEVTEENRHSPVFIKASFDVTVPENKQLYKELLKIAALDQDSGSNGDLTFSLKSGNFDGTFAIGAKNGSLYLEKPLDYEKTSLHRLVVEATDNSKVKPRSSNVNVEVRVSDVNDNKPVFGSKQYTASVTENALVNTIVTKVIATDADSSNQVSYDIVDPTGRVFFTIDPNTGIIRTRTGIDYEANTVFFFKVSASDNGVPKLSSFADVRVNVIGADEYHPRFTSTSYNFTVSQHTHVNAVIGAVSAVDGDKGIDGICVFLPRFSISKSPFLLDIATGNIIVKSKLNLGSYVLPIFVKNVMKKDLTPIDIDQATIYITVIKGNQPPIFTSSSYSSSIQENSPSGQSVLVVHARDEDSLPGGVIHYAIVNQIPHAAFAINQVTGLITVSGYLDRETTPRYELTVSATDNGSPQASNITAVIITLIDTNDNKPEISFCNGSVMENATIGTLIAKLMVTDNDIDPNRGPFTYSASSGDIIVTKNGDLRVNAPLDREKRAEYNLTVLVTDNGSPAQQSTAYCLVKIIDVSDVMPKARNASVIVNNLGPFPAGGLIGDLSPNDADISDKYICTLESGHSIFHFEPSSCRLHVASHRNAGQKTVNFTAVTHNAKLNDQAHIDFFPIINATVNKTLFLRLHGFTRNVIDFTNASIRELNDFLYSISPASTSIRVIGYKQQMPGTLDMVVAVLDKQTSAAMPIATATTVIASNKMRIQEITGSSLLLLPYKACNGENMCLNNGSCYEVRSIDSHNTLWNSVNLIFVSVSFDAAYACRCQPGFYGTRCEKIISNCSPNPCQNGGVCNERGPSGEASSSCSCKAGYTGRYCEDDINECNLSPCKNGGSCVNTYGGYLCQCTMKYTGKSCENTIDFCNPNPCLFEGKCIANDTSFTCDCKFGSQGKYCEIYPMTLNALSFLSTNSYANRPLNVSIDFATYDKNSLLLYGFHPSLTGTKSPFVGLELVNGVVRVSCCFGSKIWRSELGSVQVADGNWHTASFFLSGQKLQLKVDQAYKELLLNEGSQSPNLQDAPLYIAGVPSIDVILKRPSQVSVDDFTGCMRNIYINGAHLDKSTALTSKGVTSGCTKASGCSSIACKNGQCIDDWKGFQCQCKAGFAGETCATDAKPFTFGGTSFVMFKLKESYRRKLKLAESNIPTRRRRSTVNAIPDRNSFSVEFRTRESGGILLFAEDVDGNFTVLHIENGGVHYKFDLGGKASGTMAIRKPLITDGKWHNISLVVNDKTVSLSLDNNQASQNSFSVSPHRFYSIHTDTLSIAGMQSPRSIDGKQLRSFHGCLSKISLNNENLAIKSSEKFNVTTVGPTSNNCDGSNVCASNPCRDPVKSHCIDEWEAYRCVDPGKCNSKPCQNRGVCIPVPENSYTCNCNGSFTGKNCETPMVCLQSPCGPGENCVADDQTIYKCLPIVATNKTGLSTLEIVMIVVFTLIGLALIVIVVYIWRKRQPVKAKKFRGDFAVDRGGIEMKHTSKPSHFGNEGFELDPQTESVEARQEYPPAVITFDNDAYEDDVHIEALQMINRRNISSSQPAIEQPRSHRMDEHVRNPNGSLPILVYNREQLTEHHRNSKILQDLQSSSIQNQLENLGLETQMRRSNERMKELPMTSKLGTATPPFESGFESTGSDIDSERDQASVTDIIDGSSQLEMYDLEVASIGFSEMSWQNDNNSLSSRDIRRDFIDKRLDRIRHLGPHFNIYDYGSTISDRHTRSDRLSDRLSDLVEQDSSSDSDGSFTGSEYEYGDERISTNKLNRKHLVFSRHPQASDSEAESSVMPRRSSVDSSITNMTDFGSTQPVFDQKDAPSSSVPAIDWDQLLNWGMKYENLRHVYRDLAALGEDTARTRVSSARASERRKRDQTVQRPVKFHSAEEIHRSEEYV